MLAPSVVASRFRVLVSRALGFMGFRDDAFLLILAVLIGVITAAAAVGFHEMINWIRDLLYRRIDPKFLYSAGIELIVIWPAIGGLVTGIIANVIVRDREGRGVIDVLESVIRSSGFIKPSAAVEKIVTSAVTIGSGGSGGAEGPILQIGAAIASGIGQFFAITRAQMPLIIGCGTAAGISAIFNSPMGGLLFTLEVILLDFSIRALTPVIISSVVANVTTQAIFSHIAAHRLAEARTLAIFSVPKDMTLAFSWGEIPNFIILGLVCGIVAVTLTKCMKKTEEFFEHVTTPRFIRPAIGGGLLGVLGVAYIMIFGWLAGQQKPIPYGQYPMPAFFGDGYGFIQQLFGDDFYKNGQVSYLLSLLAFLCVAKIVGTCLTIGSGGSGGIIAPALFLGAVVGGFTGMVLQHLGAPQAQPGIYALVGMGAVLAAVVHAPLAAILILLDLTGDYPLAVPAMLASILATGTARRIYSESIYTMTLRERGLRTGGSADQILLRRMSVEQVQLEPAPAIAPSDPFQRVLDLSSQMQVNNFPVLDKQGYYIGMLTEDDVNIALMEREAVPLLTVGEVMRHDIPFVRNTDDLGAVMDIFSRHEVDHLPVCLAQSPGKIIGLISRAGLMRCYQAKLVE
jgi:CIC family chloride channel protein